MRISVLLRLRAWLLVCGVAKALTPSSDSEYLMPRPATSLGEFLLEGYHAITGRGHTPQETGAYEGPQRKLRRHLDRGFSVSQGAQSGVAEGSNKGESVKSKLSPSPVEISKVELNAAGEDGASSSSETLPTSSDLSGNMLLHSALGDTITLSKDYNPHYYTQRQDCAVAGEFAGSCSMTKLEMGFVVVAAALLLLGIGVGAYFAIQSRNNNQLDEDEAKSAEEPQGDKTQRVLRLRSNSQ